MKTISRPSSTYTTRFLSKKTIIFVLCCLYAVHLFNGNSDKKKKPSSLRASNLNKPVSVVKDQPKAESSNNEQLVDEQQVQQEFNTVISEIEETANEESSITMGWLHQKIADANKYIHRAIDTMLLRESNDLSEEDVENFDEEISQEVEKELQLELQTLIDETMEKIQNELKSVEEDELGNGKMQNEVEGDVESIRSYYTDRIQAEIDELEKKLESKIHSVTEKVEKKLLKDNFGMETTDEDLEDEEVNSVIVEVEDEVLDSANEVASVMEDEIDGVEANLEEEIKKSLNEFLIKGKNLSDSEAKEIEEKILNGLEDQVSSLIDKEEKDLENMANDQLDILDENALQDAFVVSQAKELGMKSTSVDESNVADVIEPRLDSLKKELEEYLQKAIVESKERLIKSLSQVTEDVEMKVFQDEGINISDEELVTLIEKETKNIIKAEPGE